MAISQNFPDEGPTLNLNFAGGKVLDPRITFSRSSVGTYMDANGLVATASTDSPRFDHRYVNGEVESLGLLVEEQRTNLMPRSQDFSASPGGWTLSSTGASRTQNLIGPDGVANSAWTITDSDNTNDLAQFYKQISISASSSTKYCISCFMKDVDNAGITPDLYAFFLGNSTRGSYVRYTFSTDSFTAHAADGGGIQPSIYGSIPYPNGWVRLYFVVDDSNNGSNTTLQFRIYPNGRGSNTTGSMGFFGAQIEIGEFPTSYIPTLDSNTATRTEDRAVIEGTNFTDIFDTNFESFSMFVNYDNLGISTGTNHPVVIFWGESAGYDDRIEFFKDNADPYHIETRAFGGGSGVFANGNLSAGSTAATQKLAMSWSVPDYSDQPSRRWAFSFNGESVDVVNDGSGSTIPDITRVGFGINPTRTDFHGKRITFKQITLYSNALTDSQLQNLTK